MLGSPYFFITGRGSVPGITPETNPCPVGNDTEKERDAACMIKLNNIVVRFGDFTALHDINVHVKEGEFFTFLGPSGCGKTTTLRTITGFIDPAEGTVHVKDKDITHVPIEDRNIGIVFQSYALFPQVALEFFKKNGRM